MMGPVKRPYRKMFRPVGHDLFSPKVTKGNVIKPGSVVTVTHHNGPFRTIEDEHGNQMAVGRYSLDVLAKGQG